MKPLSLSRRVTNQAVIEQAAIAGALNPDILADRRACRQAADYIARRLDVVSPPLERGWTGEPTPDGGLAFTRRLRGVQERHVIDGPLIKSAEARKLDALAAELQASTSGPAPSSPRTRRRAELQAIYQAAHFVAKDKETISSPTELYAAVLEADARASPSSATRAWAR